MSTVGDVDAQKGEGRGEKADRVAKATPAPRKADDTWMTPIADLHAEILGGKMACAKYVRLFTGLLKRVEIGTVLRNQRHYLEDLVARGRQVYLDYPKWAETFGTWDTPRVRSDRPTAQIAGKDFRR